MSIRIQLVQFLALCREGNVDAVRLFAVRCRAVAVTSKDQGGGRIQVARSDVSCRPRETAENICARPQDYRMGVVSQLR